MSSSTSPLSCLRFSYSDIERMTNNFFRENINEFGERLYSGNISGYSYSGEVSVVRFYGSTFSFENVIKVLTARNHINIISLLGFCDEKDRKIHVYKLKPNHSLSTHLYKRRHNDLPAPLTVEQRLEICLGVAKGLCHLHSGTDFYVIHGGINCTAILLDTSLVPKISNFRHARTRGFDPSTSKATREEQDEKLSPRFYFAPECNEPDKISQKSDVYAFGVLLLESLCEKSTSGNLLIFALPYIMKGELPKSTPEHVKKNITLACARQCEKIILNCLEFEQDKRPCMTQVVQDLELAIKLQKDQHISIEKQPSSVNNRCRSFSLAEIEKARDELSIQLGKGGFGAVYRGKISINGNKVDVAMKFLNANLEHGISAFKIEKKLLSSCDHVNIISLVGYCDEKDANILVYEFMPNGSLYDYLFKPKDGIPRLTVEQRMEICLGVAKGLGYLHSRNDYNIIHSDLKTDNILLDASLVPKISDFGLSRTRAIGPSTSSQVTKHIQGTEGYLAPECYEPNYKVSRKADVYAFGVVLLEVLCEKPAWERLVIWALPFVSKGELPKFTPKHVVKYISPEFAQACANLIRDCLEIDPNNRPTMSHVIANLELALTLQKMNTHGNNQKNKSQAISHQRFSLLDIETATNKFAHQNYLGNEGSGMEMYQGHTNVYRGTISVDVAVKRRTTKVDQIADLLKNKFDNVAVKDFLSEHLIHYIPHGMKLIQNEIDLLQACHHVNIISLVGYCDEPDEKILVYEFMPNGSLYDCLHIKQDSSILLTVEQRLEICLGMAKGLSYLHSNNIIHRFLTSKNILLDRNFVAKIGCFEFATKGVLRRYTIEQINIRITGMEGYFAPEFEIHDLKVSQKADVYSFGVILLEALCERLAKHNLVEAGLQYIRKGELVQFTPEHVRTYISPKCVQACANLLGDCLESDPNKRPSMNQVVEKLELALKLQNEGF